jgi:replicative DNA helicase
MEESPVTIDLAAEAAFLGSLILDCSLYPQSKEIIFDADFFGKPEHGHIYRAITELIKTGKTVDLIILRDMLIQQDRLTACGGVDYLVKVAESTPTAANILYYGGIIRDKYLRRRAIDIAQTAARQLGDAQNKTEEITARTAESYNRLFDTTNDKSHQLLSDVFADMENKSPDTFITTGYAEMDEFFVGFGKGHVIIIAGRPGMGKTALMLGMAYNMSSHNKYPVAYFSLEMTRQDIANRIHGFLSGYNVQDHYRKFRYDDATHKDLMEGCKNATKDRKIVIDQTRGLTTDFLRNKIRYYQGKYGIQAAFVDYLQLLHSTDKTKDLYTRVCLLSHEIKSIALQLEIPLIVGCQLNRGVEHRPDKRPEMSDLRDSGKIEEDADLVIMIHRSSYYEKPGELADGTLTEEAEIIVRKNRANGKTGPFRMCYTKANAYFGEKIS